VFVDLILNDYRAMQLAVLMNINNFNTFKWPFCFIVVNIKVQLTPKFFFAYINLLVFLITAAKKLPL
jgi:hypothetical protein